MSHPKWRDRFKFELQSSYSLFSLEEPCQPLPSPAASEAAASATDPKPTTNTLIDVAQSFAPRRSYRATPLLRAFFLLWTVQVLAYDLYHYPPHNYFIYMGYLTHWGHALSILYLTCSLACCLRPGTTTQPQSQGEKIHPLVKVTWALFSTVAPLEVGITLLYWLAISTEPPRYVSVMEHGGISALVLLDGLAVGLVPIRVKHFAFLLCVCVSYLVWSGVDYIFGIGNGEWGPAYNDDAFYPILNWGHETRTAALVSGFAACVLCPALFWLVWMLSLASRDRSRSEGDEKADEIKSSLKCGHFCCCCCYCCCQHISWDGSRRPVIEDHHTSNDSGAAVEMNAFDYKTLGALV